MNVLHLVPAFVPPKDSRKRKVSELLTNLVDLSTGKSFRVVVLTYVQMLHMLLNVHGRHALSKKRKGCTAID